MAFATLFYGSLSDRYGRRPVLLSGLALFLVGSVRLGAGGDAGALVLGRLIQAIGAGVGLPLVRAIARDAYRADQLIKAIAYLTMFGTLGPMVSPTIGGVLIDTFGWRSVFVFARAGRRRDRADGLRSCSTKPIRLRAAPQSGESVAAKLSPHCSAGFASTPSCCKAASPPAPSW